MATQTKHETHSKHGSQTTTDRDEIIAWAEARGAKPSCVRGTGGKGDIGMLRLDFPGYSGEGKLEEISWDDWFDKFEERRAKERREEIRGGEEEGRREEEGERRTEEDTSTK